MFKELYGVDVSTSLISRVTDSVKERVMAWQNRVLDAIYPIVYFDCILEDYKAVMADLKWAYQAPTEAQARENLTALSQKWLAKNHL